MASPLTDTNPAPERSGEMKTLLTTLATSLVAAAIMLGAVGLSSAQQGVYLTKKCETPAEQALKIKTGRC